MNKKMKATCVTMLSLPLMLLVKNSDIPVSGKFYSSLVHD